VTIAKVVDASAIAAIVFDELTKEVTVARLRGAMLYAPALLTFEVANVALKKIRGRPAEREALIAAHGKLDQLDILYHEVDLRAAITLAERTSLTLHDACYLWLARELDVELVTLDVRLERAAAKRYSA
jgi:predicted nucleic acid-binding protein